MPDATNPMTPEPRVPCVGCGNHHGGVNFEMNCMRQTIRDLRAELAPWRAVRADVAKLPPSRVALRGR